MTERSITVGWLRERLEGLPDDQEISVEMIGWHESAMVGFAELIGLKIEAWRSGDGTDEQVKLVVLLPDVVPPRVTWPKIVAMAEEAGVDPAAI